MALRTRNVDMQRVKARKDEIVRNSSEGVRWPKVIKELRITAG